MEPNADSDYIGFEAPHWRHAAVALHLPWPGLAQGRKKGLERDITQKPTDRQTAPAV